MSKRCIFASFAFLLPFPSPAREFHTREGHHTLHARQTTCIQSMPLDVQDIPCSASASNDAAAFQMHKKKQMDEALRLCNAIAPTATIAPTDDVNEAGSASDRLLDLISTYEQLLQKCESDIHDIIHKMNDDSAFLEHAKEIMRLKISRECDIAFLVVLYPMANSTKQPGDENITMFFQLAFAEPEATIPEEAAMALQEYMQHRKTLQAHEEKIRQLIIPEFVLRSTDRNLPDTLTLLDKECAAVVEKLTLLWPSVREFRMKYDEYPALDCLTDLCLKHYFEMPMEWKPPADHRFFQRANGLVSARILQIIATCERELQENEDKIRDTFKEVKQAARNGLDVNDIDIKLSEELAFLKLYRKTYIAVLDPLHRIFPDCAKKPGDDNVTMMLREYFGDEVHTPEERATLLEKYEEYEKTMKTNEGKIRALLHDPPDDLDMDNVLCIEQECIETFEQLKILWPKLHEIKMFVPERDTCTEMDLKRFAARKKRMRADSEVQESQMSPDKKTKTTPPSPKSPTSPKDDKAPASPQDAKAPGSPLPPKTKIDHHAFPRVRPNYVDPWPFISDWNPMCDACGKVFDDHSNVGRQIQFHKGRWCRNTRRIYQCDLPNNGGSYNAEFDPS